MATYYVGIGGNDANAGTSWALRKLTLNGAEDIPVAAGDEVVVGPGTYRESLTVDVSGGAGNVITYTGDYTGARTTGAKGVVRITGSADDIALTRASCITASSKNYRTFRGFTMDLTSGIVVSLTTTTNVTISDCLIVLSNGTSAINCGGASQSNLAVTRCMFQMPSNNVGTALIMTHSANVDNAGHAISNCIFVGGSFGVNTSKVGGVTVTNCLIKNCNYGAIIFPNDLTAGQTMTVNNCIFDAIGNTALFSVTTVGALVENYNTIWLAVTTRLNTTAGANSVTRPPLFDTRWFFEMVNGGRMVTPFDLASYSTLVEYNSGTGAPSTDIRGASVVGTYREWGALEYDSTLSIAGGGASRVIGSPFIRGLGAV